MTKFPHFNAEEKFGRRLKTLVNVKNRNNYVEQCHGVYQMRQRRNEIICFCKRNIRFPYRNKSSLDCKPKCYTRAVWKVRGLTLLLQVGTLWRCSDGLFFEVLHLASGALFTMLHPLFKNMLQTVCCKLLEDSRTGTVLGLLLWGSSFTFVSPSLKFFHHLKTPAHLIASSP